jgi:hypothetical protein
VKKLETRKLKLSSITIKHLDDSALQTVVGGIPRPTTFCTMIATACSVEA